LHTDQRAHRPTHRLQRKHNLLRGGNNNDKNDNTAKADEDVVKDRASIGVKLFQIFVLASGRLGFHRLEVYVMVDETFEADVLATEPRQFAQLPEPDNEN